MQARRYAFKCHRKSDTGDNTVYPVNAIAFHPFFGTFASGGMLMTLHVSYKAFNFVKEDYTPLMQHLKLECYEMRAIAVMPCISETLPMSCVCLVMKQTPTFVLQR